MTKTSEYYRNWAIEMRMIASECRTLESYRTLMSVAETYERLAHHQQTSPLLVAIDPRRMVELNDPLC